MTLEDELDWADFQVRSDTAVRRRRTRLARGRNPVAERGAARRRAIGAVLARGHCARCAPGFPLDRAAALVAGLAQGTPAAAAAGPDELGRGGSRPAPLHPSALSVVKASRPKPSKSCLRVRWMVALSATTSRRSRGTVGSMRLSSMHSVSSLGHSRPRGQFRDDEAEIGADIVHGLEIWESHIDPLPGFDSTCHNVADFADREVRLSV